MINFTHAEVYEQHFNQSQKSKFLKIFTRPKGQLLTKFVSNVVSSTSIQNQLQTLPDNQYNIYWLILINQSHQRSLNNILAKVKNLKFLKIFARPKGQLVTKVVLNVVSSTSIQNRSASEQHVGQCQK